MCSVGGGDFDLNLWNVSFEELNVERYKCKACGGTFSAIGKEIVCPSCLSRDVVMV